MQHVCRGSSFCTCNHFKGQELRVSIILHSQASAFVRVKHSADVRLCGYTLCAETVNLCRQQLGESIPENTVNELYHNTSGHPMYVVEILSHLREVQDSYPGDDSQPFDILEHLRQFTRVGNDITDRLNLMSMITSRIDRLIPTEQLTLKVRKLMPMICDTIYSI